MWGELDTSLFVESLTRRYICAHGYIFSVRDTYSSNYFFESSMWLTAVRAGMRGMPRRIWALSRTLGIAIKIDGYPKKVYYLK